jgi:hypothetical protein
VILVLGTDANGIDGLTGIQGNKGDNGLVDLTVQMVLMV